MKIEFDLPRFERELNINIIIRKDGEVVYSTSSSSGSLNENTVNTPEMPVVDDRKKEEITEKKEVQLESRPVRNITGNMMNMDF